MIEIFQESLEKLQKSSAKISLKLLRDCISQFQTIVLSPENAHELSVFSGDFKEILNAAKKSKHKEIIKKILVVGEQFYSRLCNFEDEDDFIDDLTEVYHQLGQLYFSQHKYRYSKKYFLLALEGYQLLINVDKHYPNLIESYKENIIKICATLNELYKLQGKQFDIGCEFPRLANFLN